MFFSPDAIYDCATLYSKNYKISGEYKLPKDEFLGTPELSVSNIEAFCILCTTLSWKFCNSMNEERLDFHSG